MMINDPRDIWKIEVYDNKPRKYSSYDDFDVTIDDVYEEDDNIVIAISGECRQWVDDYRASRLVTFEGTLKKDVSEFYVTRNAISFEGTVKMTLQIEQITDSIIEEDLHETMRHIRSIANNVLADEYVIIDESLIPYFLNDDLVASTLVKEIKKIDSKVNINDDEELCDFLNEYVLDTSYGEQYDKQKWAPVYKTYVNLFNSKIKDGTIGSFVSDMLSEPDDSLDDVEIGARVWLAI